VTAVGRIAHLSCRKARKTRIFTPVRDSSGEDPFKSLKAWRAIEGKIVMSELFGRLTAAVIIGGTALAAITAVTAADADKAALRQATATCKAQVKEYARFNETSWYARHKMVKNCIKDALAQK
jgi:hypothetical protein